MPEILVVETSPKNQVSSQDGALPDFGAFAENCCALDIAVHHLATGEWARGIRILKALEAHITRTEESKSAHWILPKVQAALRNATKALEAA
jgi:hypothetical protein